MAPVTDSSRHIRRQLRLHNAAFILLWLALVGLLGWFGERLDTLWDLTAAGRHSLSHENRELLARFDPAPRFTLYARPGEQHAKLERLLARYTRARPDLQLERVDPDLEPERTRAAEVARDGELHLAWGGRLERLTGADEQRLHDALQRLLRGDSRPLLFLTGHGERRLDGRANHDLGAFGAALVRQGLVVAAYNPAGGEPPDDALLVVAGPQRELLAGEGARLLGHLARGGNLLWLQDPGPLYGLEPLATALALQLPAGRILDPNAERLDIHLPEVCVVADYARSPALAGVEQLALLIGARPLLTETPSPWQVTPLFKSPADSRLQLGDDRQGAMQGSFPLALALTRARDDGGEQRVVVVGDGDFLANSYLGNQGNQALGRALVEWLAAHDGSTAALAPRRAPDIALELSAAESSFIGLFFLFLLPGGLFLGGFWVWRRRRRR